MAEFPRTVLDICDDEALGAQALGSTTPQGTVTQYPRCRSLARWNKQDDVYICLILRFTKSFYITFSIYFAHSHVTISELRKNVSIRRLEVLMLILPIIERKHGRAYDMSSFYKMNH
jgi:hypothetical protein